MPVIVAGYIDFKDDANEIITSGREHIDATFPEAGCIHYAWTADPLHPGRVWVYEEWTTSEALVAHLAAPPYLLMRGHLGKFTRVGSSIQKYRCDLAEPVYDADGKPRGDFFTG